MTRTVEVRSGAYRDSVGLMQVSTQLRSLSGVEAALVAMATELNLDLLDSMGFDRPVPTSPNDMLVAIDATDTDAVTDALRVLEAALAAGPAPSGG
ncbi:MAG: FdrA family protein, partial [Nocardioidaceae bacterium]|nr:FdrA family protein [Nocardioidaceae bacterium]